MLPEHIEDRIARIAQLCEKLDDETRRRVVNQARQIYRLGTDQNGCNMAPLPPTGASMIDDCGTMAPLPPTGASMIDARIGRIEAEQRQLKALLGSLPRELSPDADYALCELVRRAFRE